MARHSKWHNIKHKKMAEDARKGKVFTKHAKLIAIAARNGADPSSNPLLKVMIDNAKAENVPNDNIERAIKKGAGADKNAAVYEEMLYEGFGPGGVAMLIQAITDNKNRALGNIKVIMGKKGGRMADPGSVAWMFRKAGLILAELPAEIRSDKGVSDDAGSKERMNERMEEIELKMIDLGARDVETDENMLRIVCAPEDLGRLRKALEEQGLRIESAAMTYEAANKVELTEEGPERAALEVLLEALENEEDVDEVFTSLA
jgi:YebC/PmpR family DNA-binding regulatory protein